MQRPAIETTHGPVMPTVRRVPSPSGEPLSQSEQTRLHILWNECMKHSARPVKHDNTVVLLLSWGKTCDDLQTAQEVTDLATVFRDDYGFKVEQRLLNHQKRAQAQVNQHLANFVANHDNKHSLLIIYYAGHGWSEGSGEMMLAGKVTQAQIREGQLKRNSIAWHSAETIIASTDADVLVIFDCCHAGSLCRPYRSRHSRCFEFLAACTADKKTRKPGEDSFTSALIWALKELAEKPFFSSSELQHMITKAPKFPKDQFPQLFDRFDPSPEHISIAPLRTQSECCTETPQYREELDLSQREYLDLRFHFNEKLDDMAIRQTAAALRSLLGDHGSELSAERISFKGKYSLRQTAEAAARHWLDRTFGDRTPSTSRVPDLDTGLGTNLVAPPIITPATSISETASDAGEDDPSLSSALKLPASHVEKQNFLYHIKMLILCIAVVLCVVATKKTWSNAQRRLDLNNLLESRSRCIWRVLSAAMKSRWSFSQWRT